MLCMPSPAPGALGRAQPSTTITKSDTVLEALEDLSIVAFSADSIVDLNLGNIDINTSRS